MTDRIRLTLTISDAVAADLSVLAEQQGLRRAELIERILTDAVEMADIRPWRVGAGAASPLVELDRRKLNR